MPLADYLDRMFKVKTRDVPYPEGVTSLGTTAQKILGVNPNRLAWVVVNLSTNVVYLEFTNAVSSSRGIRLAPSGGAARAIPSEDFQTIANEVWAVASGVSSAIYCFEVVEY